MRCVCACCCRRQNSAEARTPRRYSALLTAPAYSRSRQQNAVVPLFRRDALRRRPPFTI